MAMTLKFFDLFSGIGGFHLGLKDYFECVGACEIDEYARRIYSEHFKTKLYFDAREIGKDLPDFDILSAGFPCQAFSLAGQRRGFSDTRGTLFFDICRIAKEKRPRCLFLENVKGLLYNNKGQTFKTMLDCLEELGYDAEWQVINSKYFVPQNRERVFIIGHLRGEGGRQIFPLGENIGRDPETQRAIEEERKRLRSKHSGCIDANYYKGGASSRTFLRVLKNSNDDSYRIYDSKGLARTLRASQGGMGKMTGLYMMSHTQQNMKQRYQQRKDSWTLDTTSSKMAVEIGDKVRRLTPTECERLQGFPDGWTKSLSDTQRYKCLGNAVTVPVIKYIGKALYSSLV